MLTEKIYHDKLPIIDYDLPKDYNLKIDNLINNFKLNDLREKSNYDSKLEELKNNFTLRKVVFGKPEIIDHLIEEVIIKPNYEYLFGHKLKQLRIIAQIQFSGSSQLFFYRPNGYDYGSNSVFIYQPTSNSIKLDVISESIDNPNDVTNEINKAMELTYQFINSNNKFTENWNNNIEPYIENKLQTYYLKLVKIYNL